MKNNSELVEISSELVEISSELVEISSELVSRISELLIISVFRKTPKSVPPTLIALCNKAKGERFIFTFVYLFVNSVLRPTNSEIFPIPK